MKIFLKQVDYLDKFKTELKNSNNFNQVRQMTLDSLKIKLFKQDKRWLLKSLYLSLN